MTEELIIHDGKAKARYIPGFYPETKLDELVHAISWRQNRIRVFGKEYDEPRLTAWFGPPYTYSNISWPGADFPSVLLPIKEKLIDFTGFPFNSVLLNLYRDGNDAMGWHRDNEKEMDTSLIASVSFGATRSFRIRPRIARDKRFGGEKKESHTLELEHGSLLLMEHLQEQFEHSVPRRKRVHGERLNLTFRRIIA